MATEGGGPGNGAAERKPPMPAARSAADVSAALGAALQADDAGAAR